MSNNVKHCLIILLQFLALEIHPDGVVRVGKTRVTLDTLVTVFLEGATPEEIGDQYPSLQLSDIYAVISYYLKHKVEVDTYIFEHQRQAEAIRQEIKQRFNPVGIRERLLARKKQQR